MVKIIDYTSSLANAIDDLDESYWGVCETEKVSLDIKANDIVKIALDKDKVVGMLHFKIIGDLVDAYHILVDEEYQHQGIATKLMREAFKEIEKLNVKTIIAHAVIHDGKINAKKLLENFGFKEIYQVENYWDALSPNTYCKQCNSNKCHCGVAVYLKKVKFIFDN